MNGFENAASILPGRLRSAAMAAPAHEKSRAEEFRLRSGREPTLLMPEGERVFIPGYRVTSSDLALLLEIATGASAHSAKDSLKRGFLPVKGGCRLGLCGTGISGERGLEGVKNISSASVRIPRAIHGCADEILRELTLGGFKSTIIISPPGAGKTTLLRELVRNISNAGLRVCLADERGEVAAVREGIPQFDIGLSTDVLTGVSKPESIMMLLRSMNPQVIALDEITDPSDAKAVKHAVNCGIKLLATAHGSGVGDLRHHSLYRELADKGIFEKAVVIQKESQRRRLDLINAM